MHVSLLGWQHRGDELSRNCWLLPAFRSMHYKLGELQ